MFFILLTYQNYNTVNAVWINDLNIGNKEIMIDLLNKGGFKGEEIVAKTFDADVKQTLKDNTARAQKLGVYIYPLK